MSWHPDRIAQQQQTKPCVDWRVPAHAQAMTSDSCSSTEAGDLSPGHRHRYFVVQTTEAATETNKTRYSNCSCIEGPIDTRRLAVVALWRYFGDGNVPQRLAEASSKCSRHGRDCMKTDHLRSLLKFVKFTKFRSSSFLQEARASAKECRALCKKAGC